MNARQVEAFQITRRLLRAADTASLPASNVSRSLNAIVASKSRGLRELLLIVIVARLMDPSFRASRDYAACSPRGLYPGIRAALKEAGIPHGKDGALNVAKGNPPIDSQWASARDDTAAADEVVRMVGFLEGMNASEVEELGSQLASLLLAEATRVADMAVEVQPSEDPQLLARVCSELIMHAPDRGNTPQVLAGLLLAAKAAALGNVMHVEGIEDAACVTTSTSNKLGDLCLSDPEGRPLVAYEVTIKPFNADRVDDSTEAIHAYNTSHGTAVTEMIVLCRPEDAHPESCREDAQSAHIGWLDDQDIRYQFIDLHEWIRLELLGVPPAVRASFHSALSDYVANPNTSEAVKSEWARLNP